MQGGFDHFVIFAGMRTGSNLLEDYLNRIDGITSHGEAFNPNFIGYPNSTEILGVTHRAREDRPEKLLKAIRTRSDGLGGFRFFHDHDPRILPALLADPRCAKIVLTRNPVDSYVSLQIARATDQWKLTDVKNRKTATAQFDAVEFERHFGEVQAFQLEILRALQVTGQTAFYIGYDDLNDPEILSGLASWLGVPTPPERFESKLKPQNPQSLREKVENFDQMESALRNFDRFDLSRTPNFEPRRGPVVPSYVTHPSYPLLFMPMRSGPEAAVTDWMAQLGGGELVTRHNQKTLRAWMSEHPGHRRFTVLRHPVARVHAAFCDKIVNTGPGSFAKIRNQLARFHCIPLPDASMQDSVTYKQAFKDFLRFLRLNLNGQTSIRVDAHWASQTAVLQGMSEFCLPDHLFREADLPDALPALAMQLGISDAPILEQTDPHGSTLSAIYDDEIETLCRDAYSRDYMMFGFSDWPDARPA
ncbi:sulfotransferase family 2 domain-containing protein [Marivita sp. GX14005]|uniref:sulfotransferase family 2 domain-containing protein n=1 Tax=Marivita sp. GX14005 TaxID=2942276 RepID=UPI0020199F3F|nr:sulfotransferase family 2 domain-containing protein [Marivita sp. GX14005]MCL3881438.1 sulfotransferase family 2 domain-containing protein [Marivita sp. GX14005]